MSASCRNLRAAASSRLILPVAHLRLEVGNLPEWVGFKWHQAHFGAWCIMSSPLILGFDLVRRHDANAECSVVPQAWLTRALHPAPRQRDEAVVLSMWFFLANTEAIAVHQSWGGHPGWRMRSWTPAGSHAREYQWRDLDSAHVFTSKRPIDAMQIWVKPLPQQRMAIFVLNSDGHGAHSYWFSLKELNLHGFVTVRDIWGRNDRGETNTTVKGRVPRLASEFLLLTPIPPPPPSMPTPPASPPRPQTPPPTTPQPSAPPLSLPPLSPPFAPPSDPIAPPPPLSSSTPAPLRTPLPLPSPASSAGLNWLSSAPPLPHLGERVEPFFSLEGALIFAAGFVSSLGCLLGRAAQQRSRIGVASGTASDAVPKPSMWNSPRGSQRVQLGKRVSGRMGSRVGVMRLSAVFERVSLGNDAPPMADGML